MAEVLNRIYVLKKPLFIVDRLDRPDDQNCRHLLDTLDCLGLRVCVSEPTRDLSRIIDAARRQKLQ